MADRASRYSGGWEEQATPSSAIGFILFAAVMPILIGIFQGVAGLVALVNDTFYLATREYLFQFDITTWGWIHLILGIVVALAGVGLLAGRSWARVVGITLAVLSAIANFLFISSLPVLGAAGHRPGCLRDLGAGRARRGTPRRQRLSGDLPAPPRADKGDDRIFRSDPDRLEGSLAIPIQSVHLDTDRAGVRGRSGWKESCHGGNQPGRRS